MVHLVRGIVALGALAGLASCVQPQASPNRLGLQSYGSVPKRPKLVVQIVVDQLRGDLPLAYEGRFGAGGYRLLFDGAWYTYARHPHADTETGVGHTTLATGTYPARHGVIANSWYDRSTGQIQKNVVDDKVQLIGLDAKGGSPRTVLTTTSSDELKMATAGRSKVFGVAGKDRAAIPLAGHSGKAFWFDANYGKFVSSTYYYPTYPAWVQSWNTNASAHVGRYLGQNWTLSEPKDRYVYQANANVYPAGSPPEMMMTFLDTPVDPLAPPFPPKGSGFKRTFPHFYGPKSGYGPKLDFLYYNNLLMSPAMDELVIDFAIELVERERLGEDEVTDYLAVGLSSTDIIGHWFGTMSLESEDNQLRLDRSLARLFKHLDEKVGLANTLIVFSGDHGMAMFPETLLKDYGIDYGINNGRTPGDMIKGRTSGDKIQQAAMSALTKKYPKCGCVAPPTDSLYKDCCIKTFSNPQFYLDYDKVAAAGLSRAEVEDVIVSAVSAMDAIALVIPTDPLNPGRDVGDAELIAAVRRNRHPVLSGDVYVIQRPDWQVDEAPASGEGANPFDVLLQHGSPWPYDNHVPIAFAGAGVPKQRINREVFTVDIAATLAVWLRTRHPSGLVGAPLFEVLSQ